MKPVWVSLALALVALAGCSEEARQIAEDDFSTEADENIVVTEDTGAIRGVVVDQAINPVAGANIVLVGTELVAESAPDGSFAFSELDPGSYFMEISKIGYNSVQASTEVVAGVELPEVVKVLLEFDPEARPYASTENVAGNLRCGISVGVGTTGTGFGCSVIRGTEDLVEEYNGYVKEFERVPSFIQVEMVWESTQPAGKSLWLGIRHCCDNHRLPGGTSVSEGASPQKVFVNSTHFLDHADGSVLEDGIEISTFPSGLEDLAAVGVDFGVILEQDFEYFTTEFYNFEPDAEWWFIMDGEAQPPS